MDQTPTLGPSPTSRNQPKDLETIARSGGVLRRMAARVPTYLADLRENPAWLAMFLLARTMPARRAHWLTARKVADTVPQPSMFGDISPRMAAEALRRDGIFTGLTLPAEMTNEIARFATTTPCFGNFDRKLEFLAPEHDKAELRFGRSLLSGHHFERILQCPAALAVQQDPLLIAIARHYLGGEAKLITTRTWWSFPTKAASEADLNKASFKFHFDLDDWRMLKFFFYLSDVDDEAGPHVFVRTSHRRRRLKHQLTLLVGHPSEEVLSFYGQESATTLTGPAGFGFVEDPFGFHMGTLAKTKPRLMMEVGFGISKPSRRRYHGEPIVR